MQHSFPMASSSYDLSSFLPFLAPFTQTAGNAEQSFSSVAPIATAQAGQLSFFNHSQLPVDVLLESKASVILTNFIPETCPDDFLAGCYLVFQDNPKLAFAKIANAMTQKQKESGIHPSAIIHPEAQVADSATIGPYSVVERHARIGEHTEIQSHCHVYTNVSIGDHCLIQSGTRIGKPGCGHLTDETGNFINFPHLAGVVMGNHVDIGNNVTIDSGALSPTQIEDHCVIDSQSHIGHGTVVEHHSLITGGCILSGSTKIGHHAYLGPNVVISDYVELGHHVTVSIGSCVVENVPDHTKVTGYFAKKHGLFMKKLMHDHMTFYKETPK